MEATYLAAAAAAKEAMAASQTVVVEAQAGAVRPRPRTVEQFARPRWLLRVLAVRWGRARGIEREVSHGGHGSSQRFTPG